MYIFFLNGKSFSSNERSYLISILIEIDALRKENTFPVYS